MNRRLIDAVAVLLLVITSTAPAMALDLKALWDFKQLALSEARFRAALATAQGDEALILQTQIARTYGLRQRFDEARALLQSMDAEVARAGPEVRVRHALELGRSYASATHPPALQTEENKARARAAYAKALATARAAGLDGLAVDVLHMLAFVDTASADQLKWGGEALAVALASTQPEATAWEASIRNNLGVALHQLGRYEEALAQFRQALLLRERSAHEGHVVNAEPVRVAQWMVAWTLRALGRADEALALQLQLEQACAQAGAPDPYVFEELELLYRARGDAAQAGRYAALRQQAQPVPPQ